MIGNSWDSYLKEEYQKEYFQNLLKFIHQEYKEKIIYPPKNEIFNAFRYTPYEEVKVVILGQDPYHGEGQAQGLSFSVRNHVAKPPSLQNIFKELEADLKIPYPTKNSLIPWTKQGVMLLNSVLTVEKDKAASHRQKGWEKFTDRVIQLLNEREDPIVFLLWGSYAKAKRVFITNPNHYVIESAHPSPFSAYNGFFGSRPFSKTNEYLKKMNQKEIDWRIE